MSNSFDHVSLSSYRPALLTLIAVLGLVAAAPAQWQDDKLTASDAATSDFFGGAVSISGDTALVGALGDGQRTGSVYVWLRDAAGNWTEQVKLTAKDAAAGDRFGAAVSLSGDTALIGADGDKDAGLFTGAAYVFVRDVLGRWTQQAKLTASDAALGELFGGAVSLSGDTALVGANGEQAGSAGAVYVFVRDGNGNWSEQAKLTADDGLALDRFGYSLSLDEDTALVGADKDDDAGMSSGSAYVFVRDGAGLWTQQDKLTASDAASNDFFGASLSLLGDAALVGADRDDDAGESSGSVYEFARDGMGNWTEQGKLAGDDTGIGDQFGFSVELAGDTALVGAYGDDTGGSFTGSAYVLMRDGMGGWTQRAKLMDIDGEANDYFGGAVSISRDTVLVGAYGDADAGSNSGSAFVFCLGKLIADDGAFGDYYGQSLALDGDTALIGATGGANGNSFVQGSAYVHMQAEDGTWTQQGKLTPDDGIDGNQFGYSVSLSGDTALVGAMRDGPPSLPDSGAAYVFLRDSLGNWTQQDKLTADDAEIADAFGISVSLSGNRALVGAVFDNHPGGGLESGSAYVFERNSDGTWTQEDKLVPSDPLAARQVGIAVSLSGDTALLGANARNGSIGSAYVFVRDSLGNWTQQAVLAPDDGAAGDEFGYSVSLSGDRALIGTRRSAGLGRAYVFERDGLGNWTQEAKLAAPFIQGAEFGISVALDGNQALIGAHKDAGNGSAYKYSRDAEGNWSQVQKISGLEVVVGNGVPGGLFGSAVAISGNRLLVGDPIGDRLDQVDVGAAYAFCSSPGTFVSFGNGCAGTAGIPRLGSEAGEAPHLGSSYGLEVSGLPRAFNSTPFGIFGLSKTEMSGVPLPLDATPFGFTGCKLYVSVRKTFMLYNLGGRAFWRLDIPSMPSVIGLPLYFQAGVIDFGANPGNIVFSNAGEATVVSR